MDFASYFPVYDKLTPAQQQAITGSLIRRSVPKGTIVHNGSVECTGMVLVTVGQLRAYVLSEEGREITIYRLFERDICLLSAACIMSSLQFEVVIQAEKDSEVYIVPPFVYKAIMDESAAVANYTNQIMATRFSEVMWLMEQIMWKSMDKRVAAFLIEEAAIEGADQLKLTHEVIANHLGTHREVVTRMLRYFQEEGLVQLSRGTVTITDPEGLSQLAE